MQFLTKLINFSQWLISILYGRMNNHIILSFSTKFLTFSVLWNLQLSTTTEILFVLSSWLLLTLIVILFKKYYVFVVIEGGLSSHDTFYFADVVSYNETHFKACGRLKTFLSYLFESIRNYWLCFCLLGIHQWIWCKTSPLLCLLLLLIKITDFFYYRKSVWSDWCFLISCSWIFIYLSIIRI